MKKFLMCFVCGLFIFANLGCQTSPNKAIEGAAVGGAVGAGAGAIIGHQSEHAGQGALLGGTIGALVGALAGSQMQKQPAQTPQSSASGSQVSQNQMSIQQIIDLSKQGVHEDVIIDRIRLTNSRFNLSAQDVDYLKQNGVSQKVISVMQGL